MADWYHCRINESNTRTPAEGPEVKEEHDVEEHTALKLHETIVRHSVRKILAATDVHDVIVLEVAECAKMEHQQDGHDFTV